jgi:hypothetical protein
MRGGKWQIGGRETKGGTYCRCRKKVQGAKRKRRKDEEEENQRRREMRRWEEV